MREKASLTVAERIRKVLSHFEIEKAHFAAGGLNDLGDIMHESPELFASLTLVGVEPPASNIVGGVASCLLLLHRDQQGSKVEDQSVTLPGATIKPLTDWQPWSDLITRHKSEITPALFPFLAAHTPANTPTISPSGSYGVVEGISYQIFGEGPPLILFPLDFVPSQWDALLPDLAQKYCTIVLGGAQLGMVSLLERRASVPSYLGMVRNLVQEAALVPGQSVLEVGCGTGALVRWLAGYTKGKNPITGVDLSPYMLREAANLARMEGIEESINFAKGNAENLEYPDDSFDLTLSITVLEEVNASKAIDEMIRVTKPGGRVGVIIRAMDVPLFINIALPSELKTKIETPTLWSRRAGADGLDDTSLYQKFQESALVDVKMFPYWVTFDQSWLGFAQNILMHLFDDSAVAEWQVAQAKAEAANTFLFNQTHHCALGTKPGK